MGIHFMFEDYSHMEAWIRAVIKRNIFKLQPWFFDTVKPHELHQCLFSSNVLVNLELCNVNIVLNFPMTSTCFSNLKFLELYSIKYKDYSSAQNLISSCHVLEKLIISRSHDDNDSLRTLQLEMIFFAK